MEAQLVKCFVMMAWRENLACFTIAKRKLAQIA
jgi:hypothetical protein